MTLVMTDRAHQYCVAAVILVFTQVAQPVVCECALRAHTRISAIEVSLIIIIIIRICHFKILITVVFCLVSVSFGKHARWKQHTILLTNFLFVTA
jgi:uncharacterized membrane protein